MSRITVVSLIVAILSGCVEPSAPPDVAPLLPRPPELQPLRELPGLALRCRYDPVRGLASISLEPGADDLIEGARLWLFVDARPFAPTALGGLSGVALERPVHRVTRASGEPDLYLRVVAQDADERVLAASGLCRVHSRIQLTARAGTGAVVTDLRGVFAQHLDPPPGEPAQTLDPLCGYPARLLPGHDAVMFARSAGQQGSPALLIASWDRPGAPVLLGLEASSGQALLGDHETAGGAAYAVSPSGRHVAWLAGEGARLFLWDRQGDASPRAVTPPHLEVRRFGFEGEMLLLAAEHAVSPSGGCGLYRLDPLDGASARLHVGLAWGRCEYLSWWGDGSRVAAVDPGSARVEVLRPDGTRIEWVVGAVDVDDGGALREPLWQDDGRAVLLRFRERSDASWRLGRLRIDAEAPWFEHLPHTGDGALLRVAVEPRSLAVAAVESLGGAGEPAGQVLIHVPGLGAPAARPVPQPGLTRLDWSPGGDYLLVADGGEAPVVLDRRGDVQARLETGAQGPECWSWAPSLITLNP